MANAALRPAPWGSTTPAPIIAPTVEPAPEAKPSPVSREDRWKSLGFESENDYCFFSIKPSDCCGLHTIHGLQDAFSKGVSFSNVLGSVFLSYARQSIQRRRMLDKNNELYKARQDPKHPQYDQRHNTRPAYNHWEMYQLADHPAGGIVFTVVNTRDYLEKFREFAKWVEATKQGKLVINAGHVNANTMNTVYTGVFTFDARKARNNQMKIMEAANALFGE